ncbi:MAG: hypothetical protein WD267_02655 [Balneolales bacterium]
MPLRDNSEEILNYQPATYSFGMNYRKWLPGNGEINLSSAFFYSDKYGGRLPLGISVSLSRNATFSVSTAHILTFVYNRQSPYPGLSITGLNLLF